MLSRITGTEIPHCQLSGDLRDGGNVPPFERSVALCPSITTPRGRNACASGEDSSTCGLAVAVLVDTMDPTSSASVDHIHPVSDMDCKEVACIDIRSIEGSGRAERSLAKGQCSAES